MLMRKVEVIYIRKEPKGKNREIVEITAAAGVNLVSVTNNAAELITLLNDRKIDIVFMDDKIPEEEQQHIVDLLKEQPVSLIYIVSNQEKVLKAFEACSVYCIVRPVTRAKISKAIHVWKLQKEKFENVPARVGEYMNDLLYLKSTYPKRVYLNMVGKTAVIQLDQLLYITSVENYSQLVLADGVTYSSSRNIKKYSDYLSDHPDFIKAHKSHLINKKFVSQIHREKNNKVFLEMSDGTILEVAQNRKEEILRAILN